MTTFPSVCETGLIGPTVTEALGNCGFLKHRTSPHLYLGIVTLTSFYLAVRLTLTHQLSRDSMQKAGARTGQ